MLEDNFQAFHNDVLIREELIERIVNEVKRNLTEGCGNLSRNKGGDFLSIPLGISNRHIHLTLSTLKKLFGENAVFESMRPLYQPGEFASQHVLTIIEPKLRSIQGVRILGPLRKYDQVEVSFTDAIFLGISPPVANSGSLINAVPLTLVGPAGSVYLPKCSIVANRQIHMTKKDAQIFGVKEGDFCRVRIASHKSTIFENVLIRINDSWLLQIHIDTDDANAANIRSETFVEFLGKM